MKINKVNMISDSDWDKLVQDTYKRPYVFQQQDGCRDRGIFDLTVPHQYTDDFKRDTIPEIVNGETRGVSFKAWLERDPKKPLDKQEYDFELCMWWERNFYPDIQMVANDLHAKGLLDAGDYVMNIDW